MKNFQWVLIAVGFLLVFGLFSGVALPQGLIEFALWPGMWAGIDPQDGSMNELSITFIPDGRGGGGGGGGGGAFTIVAASTFFGQCEDTSDGQGVAKGTGMVRDGILISTDWAHICRGERPMTSQNPRIYPQQKI